MRRDWFSKALLKWYAQHGRHDLPWKKPLSVYRVWVSEIMLQQTQVSTVIPYFARFMASFPSLESLANAPLDSVLQHWAGLGYYARARNLHKAAKCLVNDFAGIFPKDVTTLSSLPGIGLSTAGAIIAQAYNLRAPILDGNVKRVLCRFHGIKSWPGEKKVHDKLWELAEYHTPKQQAADYTQATMDLGATCCTRTKPSCELCPLQKHCAAFSQQSQAQCPGKKPRKKLPTKQLYMLCAQNQHGELLLQQRPLKGIWAGLWSLPEFTDESAIVPWLNEFLGTSGAKLTALSPILHTFTHYHLTILPRLITIRKKAIKSQSNLSWLNNDALAQRGLPAPIQKLIATIR
ncbi:A/G-specific adenine glycosylase [Candidatus Berkiella aquae]|uniref:Adenine DNA glycosylase n=1 Tax=Candidatus Berkiella aquae TaxID=295108 RepID=A0AAE3L8U4_9GAMM|nr:A/G-specific adenine glycosylase [Candidatus Berkiella aquae]